MIFTSNIYIQKRLGSQLQRQADCFPARALILNIQLTMGILARKLRPSAEEQDVPRAPTTRQNIFTVLVAGWASFVFGYSNNVITGTLAQTSFNTKFLNNDHANSTISGIVGG